MKIDFREAYYEINKELIDKIKRFESIMIGKKFFTEEQEKYFKELIEEEIKDTERITYSLLGLKNHIQFWIERNMGKLDFWKQVTIENAKINNKPYEVANESLKRLEEISNINEIL